MTAMEYKHDSVQEGTVVEVHTFTSNTEERNKKQLFLAT